MLWYSGEIGEAHSIKESLFEVLNTKDSNELKDNLKGWMNSVTTSDLAPLRKCVNTYFNWNDGIFNSLEAPFTKDFTEGRNNKIKVLKCNAYDYRCFDRFRNRILHIFSHQHTA